MIVRPDLAADARHGDPQKRLENADVVDEAVGAWIAERGLDEVMEVFEREAVAAAPVYDAPKLLADPHLVARQTYLQVDDPDLGSMRLQAPVPRLKKTPAVVRHTGKGMGEDNDYVFRELLGLDDATIEKLVESKVI